MLGVTVFIVSTLVLNAHGEEKAQNDNKIKWTIKGSPIVFGKDAILFCNLSSTDHCCTNTVTWMKGFDVILHRGASTNSSKYQQIKENDGFSLVIKHFDEKDVNCQYACLYGFDTYSSILRINPNDFELLPSNETTNYKIDASQLVVDVNFGKVFPSPQCEIMMNDQILQSTSEANETTNGLFLSSHIKLICELQSENCSGNIRVQCSVGKTHVINETILSDCKKLDATFTAIGNTIMDVVLGITVFLAVFFPTAVPVIIYRNKCHSRRNCCADLGGDEMRNLLPWQKRLECILEITSECFNNRNWVPSQRSKDVIKWLQFAVCDGLYLQLAATNLRINQIRKKIWMFIEEYELDWLETIALIYNRTYVDVLQKMPKDRMVTNNNDVKVKSAGDSYYIEKKLLSKKEKDFNLRIDFALRCDEKNMLVTASNNRINFARHLLWKEKNRLDSEYCDVQVGVYVYQ